MGKQNQLITNLYENSTNENKWDVSGIKVTGGGVVPELYGTMRITLQPEQIIGMFVDSDTQSQSLNILYAICKWNIDSVTDIRINGDALSEFPEIPTPIINYGTNRQPIIQAFASLKNTTLYGTPLTTTFLQKSTGHPCTGFGVGLSFPEGLYKTSSEGSYSTYVYLQLQYKLHTDSTWTTLVTNQSAPASNLTAHWSGGWWDKDPATDAAIWVEIEDGGSVTTAHVEGEKYPVGDDYWLRSSYPNDGTARPITIWHWVEAGTIYLPYGNTDTQYVFLDYWIESATSFCYYKNDLPSGIYDIRVKYYRAPHTTDNQFIYHETVNLEYIREIVDDDFIYPNVSLLAFQAIPTEKLSGGMPTIDFLGTRATVYVYNATTSAYEVVAATNPAWLCYDLLHRGRALENSVGTMEAVVYGVPHERLDPYWSHWKGWADWCDYVGDPLDENDPHPDKKAYTCSFYFNTPGSLKDALDQVAKCGRAVVRQVGLNFKPVYEHPEPEVAQRFLFSHGNILRDSFSESFSANTDRANLCEVTFQDPENYYKNDTVLVPAEDYDTSTYEIKTSSITLSGCCDRDMAIAYGRYMLNRNRYLTAVSTWSASVDSVHCEVGDIVEAPAEFGGRLLAGSTLNTLILDQEVDFESGVTYKIIINHQDDDTREECTVISATPVSAYVAGADGSLLLEDGSLLTLEAGGNMTLEATAPIPSEYDVYYAGSMVVSVIGLTRAPDVYTRYVYGEDGQQARLRRIISISRDSELKRQIVAEEFNSAVFDDSLEIPSSPFNPYRRRLIPPPLDSITMELVWRLNSSTRKWYPHARADFHANTAFDYASLSIPVVKGRIYSQVEDGDTHLSPMSAKRYANSQDWFSAYIEVPAEAFNHKTLYVTGTLVNAQGVESAKCTPAVLYIDTNYTVPLTTSDIDFDSFDYVNNGPNGYIAYFHWVPYGWELSGGKYRPILVWNGGSNYYVFKDYLIVFGYVDEEGLIPALDQMHWWETANIGDIYDTSGNLITDADQLDLICRTAASSGIKLNYSSKYLAITVAPMMKDGSPGVVDLSLPDYGLDWEYWLQVASPGDIGNKVTDNQIQNFELVYTMEPGLVFLNEVGWNYTLQSPYIDGFAFITRIQPYLWSWILKGPISDTETNLSVILNSSTTVAFNLGGGQDSADDFVARYFEWQAKGITVFYMAIVDANGHHEIFQVDIATLAVTRGVEGTTAHTWAAGAIISYLPCEQIDTVTLINDTTQRSIVCNPPVPVGYGFHCVMVAYKQISEAPGYLRCHYAMFDTVRAR